MQGLARHAKLVEGGGGLCVSMQSFVCFANNTSVMEVWVKDKVHLGTTDHEPL